MRCKKYFFMCLLIVFCISIITIPCLGINNSIYVWSSQVTGDDTKETSANTVELNLQCESAILIEQNTGKVLYEKNPHEQLRPASVTKIMSILLIMEAIDSGKIQYTDTVPCSENAASMGGSQIWLDTRETLTVDEMLKAICVNSANDCTVAMAEFLEGSTQQFVQKMNEKAKSLGMKDTVFKNCHGLDEDGHVTSSYDISLMSRELLIKHPDITKYTTIWTDTLRDGKSSLTNTNKLIRNYKGATGLKTGSTSLALYNLSASATRDNLSLIAVIMRAPTTKDRFNDAETLLNYGFGQYSYVQFAKKEEVVNTIQVKKGTTITLPVIYEQDASILVQKGQEKNIEQEINLPEEIEAPIEKGQIVGEVIYKQDGKETARTNLIANETIKKLTFINMLEKVYSTWFRVLR